MPSPDFIRGYAEALGVAVRHLKAGVREGMTLDEMIAWLEDGQQWVENDWPHDQAAAAMLTLLTRRRHP